MEVPKRSLGRLTGEIVALLCDLDARLYSEHVDLDRVHCEAIVCDASILKSFLGDRPELAEMRANLGYIDYWEAAEKLSAEALVVTHTSLSVDWDGFNPDAYEFFDYVPWLSLVGDCQVPDSERAES